MSNQKNSSLSQNILDEIESMGGNLSKVARALGLDYPALVSRVAATEAPRETTVLPEPADFRDLARPGLRRFAIAHTRSGHAWPSKYSDAIKSAHRSYDAGTHELTQHTRDGWSVLYLIPRLIPTKPRDYFASMWSTQ